jgi:nucleoid-associated protein YgaU
MSATPTPPGGVSARSGSGNPGARDSQSQGDSTSPATSSPPPAATDDPRAQTTDALSAFGPATQPTDATPAPSASADTSSTASRTSVASHSTGLVSRATTHVVQKGETLAQISQAAYGSPNYWPAIQRANPNLDPKKLHPGMTVNLPSIDEVKPQKETAPSAGGPASAGLSSSNRAAPSVDPRTQYVVTQNDSLYQISMKLYGKPTMVDKIYEANKETIGPDRAKLKLNMVLKLPEPPTQTAAR